jgi:hypothetical protein
MMEGLNNGGSCDCHEGTQQENYEVVRVELRGRQIDKGRDADGEHAEYAKDSGSDSYEPHHRGLDVGKLREGCFLLQKNFKLVSGTWIAGLVYLRAVVWAGPD